MKKQIVNAVQEWIKQNSLEMATIMIDESVDHDEDYNLIIFGTLFRNMQNKMFNELVNERGHLIEKVSITFNPEQMLWNVMVDYDRKIYPTKYNFESKTGYSLKEITNSIDKYLAENRQKSDEVLAEPKNETDGTN